MLQQQHSVGQKVWLVSPFAKVLYSQTCCFVGKLASFSRRLPNWMEKATKKLPNWKEIIKKLPTWMEEAIKKSPYWMEGAKKVANPVVLEVNSRLKHVNAWIIWCDPNVSNVTTLSCRLKGAANWAKNCVDTTFKLYPFTIYPCYLCPWTNSNKMPRIYVVFWVSSTDLWWTKKRCLGRRSSICCSSQVIDPGGTGEWDVCGQKWGNTPRTCLTAWASNGPTHNSSCRGQTEGKLATQNVHCRDSTRSTCLRARPPSLKIAENEARMVEIGKSGTSSHITDRTRST